MKFASYVFVCFVTSIGPLCFIFIYLCICELYFIYCLILSSLSANCLHFFIYVPMSCCLWLWMTFTMSDNNIKDFCNMGISIKGLATWILCLMVLLWPHFITIVCTFLIELNYFLQLRSLLVPSDRKRSSGGYQVRNCTCLFNYTCFLELLVQKWQHAYFCHVKSCLFFVFVLFRFEWKCPVFDSHVPVISWATTWKKWLHLDTGKVRIKTRFLVLLVKIFYLGKDSL